MNFLSLLIKMFFIVLLGRLVVSVLRMLGFGRQRRFPRRKSASDRRRPESSEVLGEDIVDADFEDIDDGRAAR